MSILGEKRLEYNSRLKSNFDGADLSSDFGLFLLKEFIHKIGLDKVIRTVFKINNPASTCFHKDYETLL